MERNVSEIKDRVRQFITTAFYVPDPAQVTDTVSFLDTGIVDSTGVLEIIGFLQSEFGVVVEDDEILPENLDGVSRIAAYIERKANGEISTA
jgi:acyl carrier protein